jgi:hypothetical protein
MTHHDDFTGRLENYLDQYEGVTPLPDAVRDAIRAELPNTKQVGPISGLSRFLSMTLQLPPSARYGLAAAVVLVAAIIGANLLGRGAPVGNPTTSPSPSQSSSAILDGPEGAILPSGAYYLDLPAYPARIDFELPEGWWYFRGASDVHAILVSSEETTGDPYASGWGLGFAVVDEVRADPCDRAFGAMAPAVTESAETLATAVSFWDDFPGTVEDVTLGGYSGKRVEITRAETATCDDPVAFIAESGYQFTLQGPTSLAVADRFTFLDVEGSILTIWTTDFPATTPFEVAGGASPDPQAHAADQEDLHDILESIVITPR